MRNKKVLLDRISNLPDDIIGLVLDNLRVQEVMRTRVLSTRWNRCWTKCRKLDFGQDFFEECIQGTEHKLERVIDSVLPHLDGPVEEFHLHLPGDFIELISLYIIKWMSILSQKRIRNLSILCAGDDEYLEIPSNIFTCSDLQQLKLATCELFLPEDDFSGFSKLIKLEIEDCIIPDKILEVMISKSPILEKFHFIDEFEGNPVLFNAVQLKDLILDFGDFSRPVYLEECPELKSACFRTNCILPMNCKKTCKLDNFVCHLPKIETLTISGTALISLTAGNIPSKFPMRFQNLVHLELAFLDMYSPDQLSSMFCLLRRSPNLRKLEIILEYCIENDEQAVAHCLESVRTEGNPSQIQTVKISNLEASTNAILLVRAILEWCPLSYDIAIESYYTIDLVEEVWLLKKLMVLPQSSCMRFRIQNEESMDLAFDLIEEDQEQ